MSKAISLENLSQYDAGIKGKLNLKTQVNDLATTSSTDTYSIDKINGTINAKIVGAVHLKSVLDTKAQLNAITGMLEGDLYIVRVDETANNERKGYVYTTSGWEVLDEPTMRDLGIDKVNLASEVTGILPITNVNTETLVTKTELSANFATKVDVETNYAKKTELALKINTSDVIDNVTSTETTFPLSANQGRVLKALIDEKTVIRIQDIQPIDITLNNLWINTSEKPYTFWRSDGIQYNQIGGAGTEAPMIALPTEDIANIDGQTDFIVSNHATGSGTLLIFVEGAKIKTSDYIDVDDTHIRLNEDVASKVTVGMAVSSMILADAVITLTQKDITSSASITGIKNSVYYIKDGSNGVIVTLPSANLTIEDKIIFCDVNGLLNNPLFTITIDGTVATINKQPDTFILNVPNSTVTFTWTGSTWLESHDGVLQKPNSSISTIYAPASTLDKTSINIGNGVNPTSPNTGDMWATGTELKYQTNSVTTINVLGDVGDIKMTARSSAPIGWMLCQGQEISRTTYSNLFTEIGTVWGIGDGTNTFNLPDFRDRTLIGAGQATFETSFANTNINATIDVITVPSNESLITGTPVVFTTNGTVPTGLVIGTTYYVIRLSSTTIKLATTLANAVAGTGINITTQGTGTHSLTVTYTNRILGSIGGEETHILSSTEMSHTHGVSKTNVGDFNNNFNVVNNVSGTTLSNVAMNNMQPYAVVNYIIKY